MRGQHRLKYPRFAAAAWLVFGSALIGLQAQAAPTIAPSAAATASPSAGAAPAAAHPAAANTLSPIDHEAWLPARPPDLRPGDHVLVIRRAPNPAPAANTAAPASQATPQNAARPQVQQTPAAAATPQAVAAPVPAARPQPAAARTPAQAAVSQAPQPAATPELSPIDHVLVLSVPPPGLKGAAPSADHALVLDHQAANADSPGRRLLASLHLDGKHLTEGETLLAQTRDESCRDPMNWTVIVHKSQYLVEVYYKGKHFDSFPAVFGRNPDHSAKEWEGDLRTPEGNYLIIEKYYSSRWRWFLRLNYPNYWDRTRYENMLVEGLVPAVHGHSRALGGSIGIHGTDRPRFNRLHINWTLGCISVDNDAIEELQRILPVGTLVIIKP